MRALILWALIAAFPALASAQELTPEAEAAARTAFAEGQAQFEAGNHQLALDSFQRMHDLMDADPGAQAMVSYNIALCLDRLGRMEEALATYERFLAGTPPDAPYRQRASDRVRELRGRVEFQQQEAAVSEEVQAEEPTAAPEPESGSVMIPLGIAVASVGGLALIAAIPTGVLALDGEAHLTAACPGGACPAEERGRIDETRTLGIVTDVLWVSGVVMAAAGASLLVVSVLSDNDGSETARVTPSIACTDQGCMAGVRGQF